MREYNDGTPPGTIALPIGDLTRFTSFWHALNALEVPAGTILASEASCDIAGNLNALVRSFQGDWMWVMSDDHIFNPDILRRLLAHNVPIVCPLTPRKREPYLPVVWKTFDPDTGKYQVYSWWELSLLDGLTAVDAVGSAGLLVRRKVFESIGDPAFKVGKLDPGMITEDTWFCWEARQRGFQIYVDINARMGHTTLCTLWPQMNQHHRLEIVGEVNGVKRIFQKAWDYKRFDDIPASSDFQKAPEA